MRNAFSSAHMADPTIRNLMLELEYDGTAYFGFQVQPEKPTVQAEIEKALYKLIGESVKVVAAGRTDAGVHAKGQVVNFRTTSPYPAEQFVSALNFYLPDDISVKMAAVVSAGFDARRSALRRHYRYCVFNRRSPSPFWRNYAYHFPARLSLSDMRDAAAMLVGERDFAALAAHHERTRSTTRRVDSVSLDRKGDLIIFGISANSFLTHQVRNTVGTLIWVGTGKLDAASFDRILEGKDRRAAGPTAPPQGLYLIKADYPAETLRP